MATPFRIGGRIVWSGGNKPLEAYQVKDVITKQPKFKADGKPRMARSFGLAIPSDQFLAVIWPVMHAEAMRFFPHGTFPHNFAWKYKDSAAMDKGDPAKGIPPKPYANREGWAGCHVLSVQSEFDDPTPVFVWQNGAWVQVPWDSLKTGDFIELDGTIEAHNEATPGLYVNPKGIQFTGVGQAIVGAGFDPTAAWGNGPSAPPAGATAPTVGAAAPGAPPPNSGQPPAPATPPAPGQPAGGFTPPPPGTAPGAAPPPPNGAVTPPNTPGTPTVSHGSVPPPPGTPATPPAPPVTGFSQGQPQQPPAPATPPAPPAAPQRVQAGIDTQGRPYYFKPGSTTEVEY